MRARLAEAGMDHVHVDSAGTHGYHVGEAPDERSQRAARARGYDLSVLRARQFAPEDFARFDWILAADGSNLAVLQRLRPQEFDGYLGLILDVLDEEGAEVPDPYYGGERGFEAVLDLLESACDGWLLRLQQGWMLRR